MYMTDYQEKVAYSNEKANKVVLAETDHSRSTLWCLMPGQKIAPHIHAGDHVWTIYEGTGNYLSEGEEPKAISPGTVLIAPAGESHGVENNGDVGLVFLSISAG